MYQVRFHLGAGPNHLKWQVKKGDEINYYEPQEVRLVMKNCKLRNRPGLAKQIHAGANKDVCAWVEAEEVQVTPEAVEGNLQLFYNPRRVPYWTNSVGDNLDNQRFETIISQGRSLAAA